MVCCRLYFECFITLNELYTFAAVNKSRAIELMNKYGAAREPFLFIINYKMHRNHIYPLATLPSYIHYKISAPQKTTAQKAGRIESITTVSFEEYKQAYNTVAAHLRHGNTFLTNLTFESKIDINASLKELFDVAQAKYKLLAEDQFLVFSPECFVKIQDGCISTYPMKGTIDASSDNAETLLLEDTKEQAEHATIVDLLRNDLSMVADNVNVERYRYVEQIRTDSTDLLQVSSEISGKLPGNYHENLGTILFSMLPAGSICGAPKPRTLEIIEQAEIYDRGYYTGVFGVFDGYDLDSAVMIRFIEKRGNEYYYKSGGGITYMSNAESEYEELIKKIYVPIG